MKKVIPLIFLLLLILTGCNQNAKNISITCLECETVNDATNLYCSNCFVLMELPEEEEDKLIEVGIERVDNRYDIAIKLMEKEKYKEAFAVVKGAIEDGKIPEDFKEYQYQLALKFEEDPGKAYWLLSRLGDYKDAEKLAIEKHYLLAAEYMKFQPVTAWEIYAELGDYKDSKEKAKEVAEKYKHEIYLEGEAAYLEGKYYSAEMYLKAVGDYSKAKSILEFIKLIEEYQGSYYSEYEEEYVVLQGNTLYVYDMEDGYFSMEDIILEDYKDMPCLVQVQYFTKPKYEVWPRWLSKKDGKNIMLGEVDSWRSDEENIYYKVDKTKAEIEALNDEVEKKPQKVAPSVGMTADEVRASTWGSPNKINKTTYSWGVKEQWVYSTGRYIYLDDGVVTSISE